MLGMSADGAEMLPLASALIHFLLLLLLLVALLLVLPLSQRMMHVRTQRTTSLLNSDCAAWLIPALVSSAGRQSFADCSWNQHQTHQNQVWSYQRTLQKPTVRETYQYFCCVCLWWPIAVAPGHRRVGCNC